MTTVYALEPGLDPDEFVDVLERSGLAERRPVKDIHRIGRMLDGADIVLTARDEAGLLIGVSRAITDGAYCCYLSDLAVDKVAQGRGIGRELIRRTHEAAGLETTLFLVSAPGALSYYPHVGLEPQPACFQIPRKR